MIRFVLDKTNFEYIAKSPRYALQSLEFNHDIDHLHILFKAQPKSELVAFINAYKSASSRLIKKEFPYLRKYLWKEYFWSRSYFLATTGGVTLEVLKKYVENQDIEDNRPKKTISHKREKSPNGTKQCKLLRALNTVYIQTKNSKNLSIINVSSITKPIIFV